MLLVVVLACFFNSVLSIGCVDNNGNPVDFWYGLKHPDGRDYSTYDENSASFSVKKPKYT